MSLQPLTGIEIFNGLVMERMINGAPVPDSDERTKTPRPALPVAKIAGELGKHALQQGTVPFDISLMTPNYQPQRRRLLTPAPGLGIMLAGYNLRGPLAAPAADGANPTPLLDGVALAETGRLYYYRHRDSASDEPDEVITAQLFDPAAKRLHHTIVQRDRVEAAYLSNPETHRIGELLINFSVLHGLSLPTPANH